MARSRLRALAVVASLIGLVLGTSRAAFFDITDNPSNDLAAASAWTRVQTGTTSVNGSGTRTVSISSVDPSKSFLFFQSRHAGNRPVSSMVRGRIASATSLEFVRVTDEGALGPDGYGYRRRLTITTGVNSPLGGYGGYTVRLTGLDTQALISAGKLRSDGNDLRVFFWNGSAFVEVDREVRNLNTIDTHVIFKSQADIASSSSNTDHYLFYGNPSAGAPNPLDTTNVYLWYDDASQNRLSGYTLGRGDDWHGTAWSNSFSWSPSGYYTYDTGDNFTESIRRAVNERDVLIEAEFWHTNAYQADMTTGVVSRYQGTGSGATEASTHYYASNRADSPFLADAGYAHDVSIMKDARGTVAIGPAEGSAAPALAGNQWRKQAMALWLINDTNGKFWDDDAASDLPRGWPGSGTADFLKSGVDAAAADKEGAGDAGLIVAQDAGRIRHILIRRYTEPEPTVTAGTETTIPPIDILWYVVEIPQGVSVQRGEVTQATTTVNVPITPVVSLSQAFVTWSKTPAAADGAWSQDDPLVGELTTTANLQFRVNTSNASHVIWWEVVEFTGPADINVQKGSTSLMGSATSTSATLATPVDVNSTFLLVGYRTAGTGSDVGSRMLRARLVDPSTITIDRAIAGTPDDITEIVWQAVELRNGSLVQRGAESFASGEAQRTVSISPVSIGRSVALASVQPGGGQNMGQSSYGGDDIIGVCSVTMAVAASQVIMDRNSTVSVCDVGWFVIDFAP